MSNLASALLEAQKAMPDIHTDSKAEVVTQKGQKFSYAYLSLTSLLGIVLPVLNENGLALLQSPSLREDGREVLVTTLLHAESGEQFSGETPLVLSGAQTPQTWGGAVTYARRYSLTALLGIAADEDDDGAAASRPRKASASAPKTGGGTNAPPPNKVSQSKSGVAKTDDKDAPSQNTLEEINALVTEYAAMLSVERKAVIAKMEAGPLTKQWRTSDLAAAAVLTKLRRLVADQTAAA